MLRNVEAPVWLVVVLAVERYERWDLVGDCPTGQASLPVANRMYMDIVGIVMWMDDGIGNTRETKVISLDPTKAKLLLT